MKTYMVENIEKEITIEDINDCYIGLDLGTTNSVLSFMKILPSKKSYVNVEVYPFFLYSGGDGYIPTVVSFRNDKQDCRIGREAKKMSGIQRYDCFKLRLGEDIEKPLVRGGKNAGEVTRIYLEKLLEKFKKSYGIDRIPRIVATVPETWFREASNRTAREHLMDIYHQLGYSSSQVVIQSEPVAACAYYCWCYRMKMGDLFSGHIMVVDYGGGTLDIALCQIMDGTVIKVLDRCGEGEYNGTNGCAGVAFDEAVAKMVCEENHILDIDGNPLLHNRMNFEKFRNLIEEQKILCSEQVGEVLKHYFETPQDYGEETAFIVEYNEKEYRVTAGILGKCFEEINQSPLLTCIRQVRQRFETFGVDETDGEHFQIMMIGGFSNFYGVEYGVRKEFETLSSESDSRFGVFSKDGRIIQIFAANDRSFAVSKGAALLSLGVIRVNPTCPFSLSLLGLHGSMMGEEIEVPLVQKGEEIQEESKVKYFPDSFTVYDFQKTKLEFIYDDGRPDNQGKMHLTLDGNPEIFPFKDPEKDKAEYYVGVTMDFNLIPMLHIKSRDTGEEKETSLQGLVERLSRPVFHDV